MSSSILDRIEGRDAGPVLKGREVPVSEVVQRLKAGENPAAIRDALGLKADDLVTAIAVAGLGPGPDDGPPLTQARPAHPKLVAAASERALLNLFPDAPRPRRLALAAGLLQILDAWDASHSAAQEADDLGERSTSQYWHGIAHRREPDAWNSGYWFRRVGRHPDFDTLSAAARPVLEEHGDPALTDRLLSHGWDPSAFITICTSARPGSATESIARRLQRLEMAILLETSLRNVS